MNDNAKSKAVSAGAMLRRYGEQALQEEIRALMIEWEEDIALSERVFIRASTHGKKSFWGYEGAVIQKGDDRIRVFPFPTRRPVCIHTSVKTSADDLKTLQELLRCWHELTRVKVSHLSQEALQTLDDAYIASIQPRKQPPKPTVALAPPSSTPLVPRLSPEEEARLDRQHRLVDMVRKGRLEALRPFWDKHQSEFDSSILGTAASSGQEEVLLWFLQEVKIDPTAPIEGRRAYDLASTRGTRNVFRRVAFNHPEMWDWAAAHVPSGLSEEMEAGQDKKKAERRKGLKEKMREREKGRSEADLNEKELDPKMVQVPVGPTSGPQRLGGRVGGEGGLSGLSGEMRMQIERERRARAAEARFR